MPQKEVINKKEETPKVRCRCGNKDRFEANSKRKTIDCLDCGSAVLQAVENLEMYKKLGGK